MLMESIQRRRAPRSGYQCLALDFATISAGVGHYGTRLATISAHGHAASIPDFFRRPDHRLRCQQHQSAGARLAFPGAIIIISRHSAYVASRRQRSIKSAVLICQDRMQEEVKAVMGMFIDVEYQKLPHLMTKMMLFHFPPRKAITAPFTYQPAVAAGKDEHRPSGVAPSRARVDASIFSLTAPPSRYLMSSTMAPYEAGRSCLHDDI